MKYIQPYDQPSTPTAPYVDLNEASGIDGSIPPAKFFNNIQSEILAVITGAGLTPSDADLTQLEQAVRSMIPTPTGAPSDASLVHFATDSGAVNALDVTLTPATASLAAGFMMFVAPVATNNGASSANIHTSSSTVTCDIVRDDGADLSGGELVAGRLTLLCHDGSRLRMVWRQRPVSTDSMTIRGDGVATPLAVIGPVRAWGRVVGGVLVASLNVAGVSQSGGDYTVTLINGAVSDVRYGVVAQTSAPDSQLAQWIQEINTGARTTTVFQLQIFGLSLGLPQASTGDFSFVVLR